MTEVTFLGRKIAWLPDGIDWKGDSKQTKAFLERMGCDDSKAVDTPGVKHDRDPDAPLLEPEAATRHRSLVALLNYISQDRGELSYASTELSRTMSRPRVGDEQGLKRVARYLRRYPASSIFYGWQCQPEKVEVYTDADWAGCTQTRRSTSGGLVLYGAHLLAFWSRTQQNVALSSCESEVNALIKGGVEGLGVKHLMQQCGEDPKLEIRTDASAAQGLCARQGAGRVKHLTVRQLWAQEKEANGELKIVKIPRLDNAADMYTHHWTKAEGLKFLNTLSIRRIEITPEPNAMRRLGVSVSG